MRDALPFWLRMRLLRAASIFVLLAVMLPNVLYVGHGPLQVGHSHAAATLTSESGDDDHTQHCHAGAARCGGQQSLVGTWWVGDEPLTVPTDGREAAVDRGVNESPVEAPATRIPRPPRRVA